MLPPDGDPALYQRAGVRITILDISAGKARAVERRAVVEHRCELIRSRGHV